MRELNKCTDCDKYFDPMRVFRNYLEGEPRAKDMEWCECPKNEEYLRLKWEAVKNLAMREDKKDTRTTEEKLKSFVEEMEKRE